MIPGDLLSACPNRQFQKNNEMDILTQRFIYDLGVWSRSEAETFSDIAVSMGVPRQNIKTEANSTNTGENIVMSHEAMFQEGIRPSTLILIQKPYMERRAYATFMKQWPDASRVHVRVTSPHISLMDYPGPIVGDIVTVIGFILGTLDRIQKYPAKDFQIGIDVPLAVSQAFWSLKPHFPLL